MVVEKNSIYCPYCHKHTALSVADGWNYSDNMREGESIFFNEQGKWWIGVCNGCGKCVLIREPTRSDHLFNTEIYPYPLPKPINDKIPDFLKNDLEEASKCLSISAYRGTASLARRVLQLICIDKGAKKVRLLDQIYELGEMGIITKDMIEWAHAIRWVGNDASHPEKNEVEKDDAEEILSLVEQMIHILYIAPTIAKEKREKFKNKQ